MIFVFKTSVKSKRQAQQLTPHLDKLLPKAKWNFDLQDCDKILRIESEENIVQQLTGLLNTHQFDCKELE